MQNKNSFLFLLFCIAPNFDKFLSLIKGKTVFLLLHLTEILHYLCSEYIALP